MKQSTYITTSLFIILVVTIMNFSFNDNSSSYHSGYSRAGYSSGSYHK